MREISSSFLWLVLGERDTWSKIYQISQLRGRHLGRIGLARLVNCGAMGLGWTNRVLKL